MHYSSYEFKCQKEQARLNDRYICNTGKRGKLSIALVSYTLNETIKSMSI